MYEAVLNLRNLEQLSLDTLQQDFRGLTARFATRFPRMRHLELRPKAGARTARLPRPADLPCLQCFQYEQRCRADSGTLHVSTLSQG